MKPTKSVLDPSFRYTKSIETDIRKTFKQAREAIQKKKAAENEPAPPRVPQV